MSLGRFPAALAMATLAMLIGANLRGAELQNDMQEEIARATQGEFLRIPELTRARHLPVIPMAISPLPGPQLLLSDLPEYIGQSNGVTLMETVPEGDYRLYVYHVPGAGGISRVVSVVVQNLGKDKMRLRFSRGAFLKPGTDYAAMGVAGLMDFFNARKAPRSLSIAPGKWKVLDRRLDKTAAADPQLVHAFYEFHVNQPARIAVLQKDPKQSSVKLVELLPKFPRQLPGRKSSGAGRGLFHTADFTVTNKNGAALDTADGAQRLVVADGHRDHWAIGTDALAGSVTVTNKGNYGVIYHIRLAWKSSDGRGMALLVGPPGGGPGEEWRPMAALNIGDGTKPGKWTAIIGSWSETGQYGSTAVARKFPPPARGTTNYIELTYSPPGGSPLPTPLWLAPYPPIK